MEWRRIETPSDARPPRPITVRAQTLPARSYFSEHSHEWGQLVYAVTGTLAVAISGQSLVISPEQAVWLPEGVVHRVASLLGAEFRSLWICSTSVHGLPERPAVISVGPLLKALIMETANLEGQVDSDGYAGRITHLILDQLHRAQPASAVLPWPRSEVLVRLCQALHSDPTDSRSAAEWGGVLGISARTLSRRFETELGMSMRSWRRQMRLFKAIELLGGGMDVTRTALDLGYSSPSAFIYAFRTSMGKSPQAYMRQAAQ